MRVDSLIRIPSVKEYNINSKNEAAVANRTEKLSTKIELVKGY